MSMESQTYSCNPTPNTFAGPYTYPQYVPMRTYSPLTPPVLSTQPQMLFPTQAMPVMSQPVPLQACSPIPAHFAAVPTIIQTPSLQRVGSMPSASPCLQGYPSQTASPVLQPSPSSSLLGVESLGYSMGNLSIRASPSPARPCVPFVVASQMLPTPPSTGLMTPSPTQFMVSPCYPSPIHTPLAPTAQGPDFRPRANRTRSRSPGPSISRESESSDSPAAQMPASECEPKPEAPLEPSKRDLVNKAFARLTEMFGEDRFDQEGNRGENIVRLKVKTRNALEHIVPFIERCQEENLISTVSCPISTKKGRQQVRGFLAYLETRNADDADRLEELVREYNAENKSVFNTWHRNPVSTWKTNESS